MDPRFLKILSGVATAAALLVGAGTPATAAGPCPDADAAIAQITIDAAEDAIACLTNEERTAAGLEPLAVNDLLRAAARAHSEDMVQRRYFEHDNLDGLTPDERIVNAGYDWGWWGENIEYVGSKRATPREFVDGWMQSPGHRDNILEPNFQEIGVGVAAGTPKGSTGATATQDFGSPA